MELSKALRVQPGASLAFVGAGGKTSAIRALSNELLDRHPVLITTTTKLGPDQDDLARDHVIAASPGSLGEIPALAAQRGSVLVTGPRLEADGKWTAPSASIMHKLVEMAGLIEAVLLIEADGARQKLIKAPDEHEPMIPGWVSMVVPVMSARALGRPLDPAIAHRVGRLGTVMGLQQGERITGEAVARLLSSPNGALKRIPPAAEIRALITSADQISSPSTLSGLSDQVLATSRISAILLGSEGKRGPIREVHSRTAGIILAAGGSGRMGVTKQLLEAGGRTLVRRAVKAAIDGGIAQVIVTVGDEADRVQKELADLPVHLVPVLDWRSGQSRSLRAGMGALAQGTEAVVFLLADMPWVDGELVGTLLKAHSASLASIVAPRVDGRPGNPVLFDRRTFSKLTGVQGDRGGRQLFPEFDVEHVDWDERAVIDIDLPEHIPLLDDRRWRPSG